METGLNNEEKLDDCFYQFQLALDEVLSGIANLQKNTKQRNAINHSDHKINKATLMALIQEFSDKLLQASPQASELIPQLSLALGSEHKESIENLQEMIDAFDFDEALKILKQIKTHIP